MEKKKLFTFYAYARNEEGKLEQMFVRKLEGARSVASWTGKIYRTAKEANQDMIKLNCS